MTEEICTTQPSFFDDRAQRAIYAASNRAHSPINLHNQKRRALYRWCSRITDSGLSGSDLLVAYLHGKYIKNLSVNTIEQAAGVGLFFLRFLARDGITIYALARQNISTYVEYEQDRGLKTQSVVNHLRTVYAFIVFLVDQGILPQDIMQRKIRIKLPDPLPRAIPSEDVGLLVEAITSARDRAMILLLLRTGMRIGELLNVKLSDISLSERKILIYLGEKNYQGRAVYYSEDAEQALQQWLKARDKDSVYLFPGKTGRPNLSYVAAWNAMKKSLERAGLSDKGYSFHNLRHYVESDIMGSVVLQAHFCG